jgi:hypothetical protein
MDNIERINRKVDALLGIKNAIETLPYEEHTIPKHCELRRIYLDRLRSLRLLFTDTIVEFCHQEARVERHIHHLETTIKSPDVLLDTSVAPPLPAPHNTTTESGRV